MTSNERPSLPGIIFTDLLRNGKLPLLLIVAITLSALLVVTVTYKTRQLTTQREQLIVEQNALEIEWRNLILEENALGDQAKVERTAYDKLQMVHVDTAQENIVIKHK